MALILGFGICFQLPVVLTLLARSGMITADTLKRYRRHAIFAVFVVAAVLTPPAPITRSRRHALFAVFVVAAVLPPPDPISQIALAVPTVLLYELSIYA